MAGAVDPTSKHSGDNQLPKFTDLPLRPGDPPYSAWGLYGARDELGTLNRLTDGVVLAAAREIRDGTRVSLDWELDAQQTNPMFKRQAFTKEIWQKASRVVNDDAWTFNTQSSSQWDGLRHFGYQKERVFYNGVTLDDIHGEKKTDVLGVHGKHTPVLATAIPWSKRGIVGRGILLDYATWRIQNGKMQCAFESNKITLTDLKAVAQHQGTEIKFGDILIIRSGYMQQYKSMSTQEKQEIAARDTMRFAGVEATEGVLEWIWNNFSAVAGDQPSFECWRAQYQDLYSTAPNPDEYYLHQVLLGGFGCPIGELFDLERLAIECARRKRWSFFVTSKVNNVPGGVASPPNILAIF